jgi:hypothetical protein
MTPEQLLDGYRRMALIREFEERLYALFREGVLYGTTHAYTGQEAIAVGVVGRLDRERDVITSNHRGHGHYLAYSDDVDGLLAELMGRASGACRGWGGSQHLRYGNFLSNGVLGSMIPVGVGMALAEKRKQSGAIVCNFLGDGTLGEGVVYEALNMAGPVEACRSCSASRTTGISKPLRPSAPSPATWLRAARVRARDGGARRQRPRGDRRAPGGDRRARAPRAAAALDRVRHLPHGGALQERRLVLPQPRGGSALARARSAQGGRAEAAGRRARGDREDVRARVDAALERARAAAQPRLEDAPGR